MPKFKIAVIMLFASAILASAVFSAEKAAEPAKADAARAKKPLTKEDLIERITRNLDRVDEIINFIQGLKKETDPAGKAIYTFQGTKIEDLDKDTLTRLYSRVSAEAVRIRTEKINKQLENIRRAEQLSHQVRPIVSTPFTPPSLPPVVNVPPQTPSTPHTVTEPPKTPTPPPAPPKR
ncbi:MAG: hypothetical protein PHN63_05510 [Candidatus Omnitrophica bacterium]|nr:hypothetical protein [Candidatus Omnitrophota bacterium]